MGVDSLTGVKLRIRWHDLALAVVITSMLIGALRAVPGVRTDEAAQRAAVAGVRAATGKLELDALRLQTFGNCAVAEMNGSSLYFVALERVTHEWRYVGEVHDRADLDALSTRADCLEALQSAR